jgi:NTE family protein
MPTPPIAPGHPVEFIDTGSAHDDPTKPEQGMALCMSGGGYRAMLFHAGSLWRLYESGLLKALKRISSVSGGSITAGMLGLKWNELSFDPRAVRDDFVPKVIKPIRKLADDTIDQSSVIGGILTSDTIADKVAGEYREQLFGKATLQDLPGPPAPTFVINATNVQSGALWRFSKGYMRDWRVGEVKNPTVSLAVAVGASSAFPPVLSPVTLKLDPDSFTPGSGDDLQRKPFTSKVVLTDGGVYDNLGLETIWKRYDTILVSDAGGHMDPEEEPKHDWARHSYRVLSLVDHQVRNLRKRQVIDSFKEGRRKGTYWGIRTNIADYKLPDSLLAPFERTMALAQVATRLKRLDDPVQQRLINWGYAVCDAALRKHLKPGEPRGSLPYPEAPL